MLILHILVFCILAGSLFVHFFTRPTRVRSEALGHAEGTSTRFMVASGGVLSEGYGNDRPGVCLGDGQTEAYLKDMGITGLASAWAMVRRRPIWIWAQRDWRLSG